MRQVQGLQHENEKSLVSMPRHRCLQADLLQNWFQESIYRTCLICSDRTDYKICLWEVSFKKTLLPVPTDGTMPSTAWKNWKVTEKQL